MAAIPKILWRNKWIERAKAENASDRERKIILINLERKNKIIKNEVYLKYQRIKETQKGRKTKDKEKERMNGKQTDRKKEESINIFAKNPRLIWSRLDCTQIWLENFGFKRMLKKFYLLSW